MTEKQIENAMRLLMELYADQKGIKNPLITVQKKGEKKGA